MLFKSVSPFQHLSDQFMTSLCFYILDCRLSIYFHFHSDMCFFLFRLYVFISSYAKMLIFCSLYVFDSFPDSTTSFQLLFFLGSMYFFPSFDQVTYFINIVGKSIPFSIILEYLVS